MLVNKKVEHIVEKILTISIAAYNVEQFLKDTLNSLVALEILDDIEVLIVDDGSKDCTAEIGREFTQQYPDSFFLISKTNGGYGSTINAAIDAASGKYFKTLDGDDWFDTQNFVKFVKALKAIDADLVVTPFTIIHESTGETEEVSCHQTFGGKTVTFDQLPMELYYKIKMHSVTYRTALLQENHIQIGEHCFYTDIEYIAFPIVYVDYVCFLDYSVYQYRVGLQGQSVSAEGFRKHYKDHLKVIDRVLKFYESHTNKGISKEKDAYLFRILNALVYMQYQIFIMIGNTNQIKSELMEFDRKLKNENFTLYESVQGRKIAWLRKSNFQLFGLIAFYSKLRDKIDHD